jgi:acetyltransferase
VVRLWTVVTIVSLNAERAQTEISQLAELLVDAVESGASVGFLPPMSQTDALAYWKEVTAAIAEGRRVLLVALEGTLFRAPCRWIWRCVRT